MKDFLTYLILNILLTNDLNAVELRKKVVVIDTGLKWSEQISPYICKDGLQDFTNTTKSDNNGHGTNIIHIIANHINPEEYCIISLKAIDQPHKNNMMSYLKALKFTSELRPFALNLSIEGEAPDSQESAIIEKLTYEGTKVIVSAGNDGRNLDFNCNVFPACYNIKNEKFYIVGSINDSNENSDFSNYGKIVRYKENGENVAAGGKMFSGTSQAAAIKTGKLCR